MSPRADDGRPGYSSLIPARLITPPQRCVSAAMCAAKSSGEPSGRCMPCLTNRSRTSGALNALRASAFSQSMAARGVPAGASRPNHGPPYTSGTPASAMVGTSGSTSTRFSAATASARTLPSAICAIAKGTMSNIIET